MLHHQRHVHVLYFSFSLQIQTFGTQFFLDQATFILVCFCFIVCLFVFDFMIVFTRWCAAHHFGQRTSEGLNHARLHEIVTIQTGVPDLGKLNEELKTKSFQLLDKMLQRPGDNGGTFQAKTPGTWRVFVIEVLAPRMCKVFGKCLIEHDK